MGAIFALHQIDPTAYERVVSALEAHPLSSDRLRQLFAERGKAFDPCLTTEFAARYLGVDDIARADFLNGMLYALASEETLHLSRRFYDALCAAVDVIPELRPLGKVMWCDVNFEPPPCCRTDEGGFFGGWRGSTLREFEAVFARFPSCEALLGLATAPAPLLRRWTGRARRDRKALLHLAAGEHAGEYAEEWADLASFARRMMETRGWLGVERR